MRPLGPATRALFGWLLAAASIATLSSCGFQATETPKPIDKIILISLDTLRADHLGIHSYSRDTSPEIDAFAGESFVFERALAPAPNTPPSQMSMMTSLYPSQHGFSGNDDSLAPGIQTLAELLESHGLRTAGFVDGGYLSAAYGFDRGFDSYNDEAGGFEEILPRAFDWLAANGDEPFFLFLHTYDIHFPYISPAPYHGMFQRPTEADYPPLKDIEALTTGLEREDVQILLDRYDEGIRHTDAMLGGLFDLLAESGRLDDTLILITSDHGEEFAEHGSIDHWQLYYQPNLRVPLIVRPPGGVDGPIRIDETAELVDLLPTLLALVGAEPNAQAQGRNLAGAMYAARDRETESVPQSEFDRSALAWWASPAEFKLRSLVFGDYQLIFNESDPGGELLYDISVDPMAQNDLASDRPQIVSELREIGLRGMQATRPHPAILHGNELDLDEKTREQLKILGYEQ